MKTKTTYKPNFELSRGPVEVSLLGRQPIRLIGLVNGKLHLIVPDKSVREEMKTANKVTAYYGTGERFGFCTKGWFFVFDDGSDTPFVFTDFRKGIDHETPLYSERSVTLAVYSAPDSGCKGYDMISFVAPNHLEFSLPLELKLGIPVGSY